MNAKEFKKLISDRCVEVQKYGYMLISEDFGLDADLTSEIFSSTSKYCCPIGAALLNSPNPSPGQAVSTCGYIQAISAYCNISSDQAWSFISGFDGVEATHTCGYIQDKAFFQAGKEMRAEFIKE